MPETTGILLINTGTPSSTEVGDVRRYLREFLSDPRVIDISPLARWALLNLVILPTRPKKSAKAYEAIWRPEGSPLLIYTEAQRAALSKRLGEHFVVEIGMRYGSPSIPDGLNRLKAAGCDRIIALPLYPQYSSAANGSAAERVMELLKKDWNSTPLEIRGDFFNQPLFIEALTAKFQATVGEFKPDLLLLSYHGLPERHVLKSDTPSVTCDRQGPCPVLSEQNRYCYRAQCFETSRALAASLNLGPEDYEVSFQSRLGRTPWIKPYTDVLIEDLARRGVKRLAVTSPSFVADCLETLEEIEIRLREQWLAAGGEAFLFIPCVNDHPLFIEAMAAMVLPSAPSPFGTSEPAPAPR